MSSVDSILAKLCEGLWKGLLNFVEEVNNAPFPIASAEVSIERQRSACLCRGK